jgi:pyruvate-ferredoxin/flavodoxin oxidoreductase
MTLDGNTATAHVSYAFTEVATIFPITPSSVMAEAIDEWSAAGRKNIFGNKVVVREMQSEAGAAGAMHGSLQGVALTSTYTASQGLMLMLPVMFRITGELLPGVFHVSSRAVGNNGFSIFGDHQDVMTTRPTGVIQMCSSSVQECMDLAAVAHLTAVKARLPIIHFFDGFRTSHEVQKVEVLEYGELAELFDWEALSAFRGNALNPDHPVLRGCTMNPDIYFQLRESINKFYLPVPELIQAKMNAINNLAGRDYKLFNYFGSPKAENVIISMGSSCEVIRETLEYQNARGSELGLLQVHLFRPFSKKHLLEALPKTVKKIAVLDRTKEPGAPGEPLYLDVREAFYDKGSGPLVVGGRYGLASKEFTPADVMAIYRELEKSEPANGFTVGITDDVTFLSLPPYLEPFDPQPEGTTACQFWGLGSDGTVSANKSAIKIIGDHTDMFAQAYFVYDSKKSGGLTVSHLRFGRNPIRSSYQVNKADFVACHNQAYVQSYEVLEYIKAGGRFLLNCVWTPEELENKLPASVKRILAEKNIEFYVINAVKIADELGLGGRINMITQAAFFKITNILPINEAAKYLKEAAEETYGHQGPDIVEKNYQAVEAGLESLVRVQVPPQWAKAQDGAPKAALAPEPLPDFVEKVIFPVNRLQGDKLPVSAFNGREDGTFPTGTTKYEKRGIALEVPHWDNEKCVQCNQCAFVCPHAVLRPTLLDEKRFKAAPVTVRVKDANGFKGYKYTMAFSDLDCVSCGNCLDVCPANALEMAPLSKYRSDDDKNWNYLKDVQPIELTPKQKHTLKGSQFLQPLVEFSPACAGCGETPYAKLITQLYGDRLLVANTAGCVAVWGGVSPAISYTKNVKGHGPAWGYSLFEDDAEYGYGLFLASQVVRRTLAEKMKTVLERKGAPDGVLGAMKDWLDHFNLADGTRERSERLEEALKPCLSDKPLAEIYERRDFMAKRSYWVFGGDGWAYDIGFGGLDHVLAQGENINVFVFDTEVYSNTGGQASKATPAAAVAKFAAAGKETKKKDLGRMVMSYGYVYVAQVCMGADRNQTLKAIVEAEAYEGPSLIIGYSPCLNHGIKAGLGHSQLQQKKAVEAGYWSLYRYNPDKRKNGENPFSLDSKPPTASFKDFLLSEVRFSSLQRLFPDQADRLFAKAEADAKERLDYYQSLV